MPELMCNDGKYSTTQEKGTKMPKVVKISVTDSFGGSTKGNTDCLLLQSPTLQVLSKNMMLVKVRWNTKQDW